MPICKECGGQFTRIDISGMFNNDYANFQEMNAILEGDLLYCQDCVALFELEAGNKGSLHKFLSYLDIFCPGYTLLDKTISFSPESRKAFFSFKIQDLDSSELAKLHLVCVTKEDKTIKEKELPVVSVEFEVIDRLSAGQFCLLSKTISRNFGLEAKTYLT